MATKEKKVDADSVSELDKCPIRKAIENNNKRIQKINGEPVEIPERKKKEGTKAKKKYPLIIPLKVALFVGALFGLGYLWAYSFVPDVLDAVMAFIGNFDPLRPFRGNGNINPDNYVMFLK